MIYYSYFHSVMTILGELRRQYKDFQVPKEDWKNHDSLQK